MGEVTHGEVDEAIDVAKEIEASGPNDVIIHESSRGTRHQFSFKGLVQAHRLDDDWMFVGFDQNWFAIEKDRR
jgi:hypothetical protein